MNRHAKASPVGSTEQQAERRRPLIPATLTSCLVLLVGLLLLPSAASAKVIHQFEASFGSAGHGAGQLELHGNSGIAVNQSTGDLYVADTGNHRVDQFDSSGAFIRAFGADVGGAGVNVCTTSCVAGTSSSSPGGFEAPTFIAIDNSGGPSNGDVYVADTTASIVQKFDAEGNLLTGWAIGGQLNGSAAPGGPFTSIQGIAVDSTGNFYVYNSAGISRMVEFEQDGSFAKEFSVPFGTSAAGIAVDSSGNIYVVRGSSAVAKLDPEGSVLAEEADPGPTTGVAATGGQLFVAGGQSIRHYDAAGARLETFGTGDLTSGAGLAVDGSSEAVYAADAGAGEIAVFEPVVLSGAKTEAASGVGKDSAVLHGTISADGGPPASCNFEYTTKASFEAEGFQGAASAPCVPGGPFTGSSVEAVSAQANGLLSSTVYDFRIVGINENASSPAQPLSFQTLGPLVLSEAVSSVGNTSATVGGLIDPRGEETEFAVEYVSEAQFLQSGFAQASSAPVPPLQVGAGFGPVEVIQEITALSVETTYHFRLVATNPSATAVGPDKTFTTFPFAIPGPPDARAYEMVSPANKAGEVIPPERERAIGGRKNVPGCPIDCLPTAGDSVLPMQTSLDGNDIVYEGQPFQAGLASGANQYLATRAAGGWKSESQSGPRSIEGQGLGFKAFSPDLSRGIIAQQGALSPTAPSHEGKTFANLYLWQRGQQPTPLIADAPPNRSPDGPGPSTPEQLNAFQAFYASANAGTDSSPALSHVVFEADDTLTAATASAPAAVDGGPVKLLSGSSVFPTDLNLYEWTNGQLRLVNAKPGNSETAPGAVLGSGGLITTGEFGNRASQNLAASNAISADGSRIFWTDEASGVLYVRINGTETRKILDPSLGLFLTANTAGTKVLFNDGCLYDLQAASEPCTDLTEGEGGFLGILGAADDLSHVYFVDTAVLTPGQKNAAGQEAQVGADNLYAWHEGGLTFLGTLVAADNDINSSISYGDWKPSPSNRVAQVSPDGRFLAFMSKAPLTGYDNAVGGIGCNGESASSSLCYEVFEYDAASGELACVSCNPAGIRPQGQSNLSLVTPFFSFASLPQPNNLVSGGRLFFESQDVLTSADQNGPIMDVYEWEPQGIGSCERASGCVSLISSGHSANDSLFVDATPSGNDAFFITREQLLPRDRDERLDIYDARVGGGIAEDITPPCGGEACKGSSTIAPGESSPASATFSGPPNEEPKHHKQKKKKKQSKHKKKSKSHHKRSAKHNTGGSK